MPGRTPGGVYYRGAANVVEGQNAYLRTQILTARPEQLTLMLFDGAIRFTRAGREAIGQHDYESSFNSLQRAEQIMVELLNSLRHDVDDSLCKRQASLYLFVYSKLVEANMSHRAEPLDDALNILATLRETWTLLIDKLQTEASENTYQRPEQMSRPTALSIQG